MVMRLAARRKSVWVLLHQKSTRSIYIRFPTVFIVTLTQTRTVPFLIQTRQFNMADGGDAVDEVGRRVLRLEREEHFARAISSRYST